MYLHIGNNQNLRIRDIVGIFDADTATVSNVTKKYINEANRQGRVAFASEEIPKSFVLCRNRKKGVFEIYFSQLSTAALCGRIDKFGEFETN